MRQPLRYLSILATIFTFGYAGLNNPKKANIAERIEASLDGKVKGIVYTGSSTYESPENEAFYGSDFDMQIVLDKSNLEDVLNSQEFDGSIIPQKVRECFMNGDIHSIALKETIDDIPTSIHFFSAEAYEGIANNSLQRVSVYRTTEKSSQYRLRNLEGEEIAWDANSFAFEGGYMVHVPTNMKYGDKYYVSVNYEKMLKASLSKEQFNDYLSNVFDTCWNTVVEQVPLDGKVDLEKRSPSHALAKADKMPKSVMDKFSEKCAKKLDEIFPGWMDKLFFWWNQCFTYQRA